jgi:serine/threonine protein kinase/tetratricopeptide (TPR) repeat protein
MTEETLFHLALPKSDPAERAAFLEAACYGQPQLRARVEALLQAHEQAGPFLDPPTAAPAVTGSFVAAPPSNPLLPADSASASLADGPGTQLGPYKLLQKLGEGGMGTVWMAEQQEPVQRRVALKVIKAGMDSAHVLARFAAERQALALMDHPHIARVFDAGTTATGRPFFVMELVQGIPITRYCDQEHLTPKERLELFVPVCQAVQHAHQKGIIHRDLKPSNILVALYDGKPVVKVIDFGVAKATGQRLTEKTMFTEVGQMVGTLEYMSPEQAELNNLDIDTRADIYSLGVVLYELLTGRPPFTGKQLRNVPFPEMLRLIREVEPATPSTRLAHSEELPTIAAKRKMEPKKLTRLVRGELDWIVMKCLEKERHRRYETANQLALEIQRYLADEPVQAGPSSASHRLKKFLRRNKGPVLAASLLFLVLLVGVVGTSVGLVQAESAHQAEAQQRRLAETERDQKETARRAAVKNERQAVDNERRAAEAARKERKAKELAQQRLAQIEKANEILASVFQDLDPRQGEREGLSLSAQLGQRLDRATALLEGEATGDALVVAGLQNRLGLSQVSLGYPKRGIVLLTRARATFEKKLGPDHVHTLGTMHNLANAYIAAGQLDKAVPLYEQTLAKSIAMLGPNHSETLKAMNGLAMAYSESGQHDKAVSLLQEVLTKQQKRAPDHPDTLGMMSNLANAYIAAGQPAEALPLLVEALAKMKARLGPDHPDTLTCMNTLAVAYVHAGQQEKGVPLLEETLARRQAKLGPGHPTTLGTLNNLAAYYWRTRQLDRSIPLFEKALPLSRASLGPNHRDTLITMVNLGVNYRDAKRLDEAISLLEEAFQRLQKASEAMPANLTEFIPSALADTYERAGQFAKAEPLYRGFLKQAHKEFGADDPRPLGVLAQLGSNLLQQQKYADAEALLRDCLKGREKIDSDSWLTFNTKSMLGAALLGQKKYADAEPLLLKGYEGLKKRERTIPPLVRTLRLTEAIERLVQLYEATGKADEADKWRKRLPVRKKQP